MKDYLDKYPKVMDLAKMSPEAADKTFPFVGASRVMMPYLDQASKDFWSRTFPHIAGKKDIAKVETTGKNTVEKEMRAERVGLALNFMLRHGIEGWIERQSFALNYLPNIGMYFKKKWYEDGSIKDAFIPADKMIYDHHAKSFNDAPRKSHHFTISADEYRSRVVSGIYVEIDDTPVNIACNQEDYELIESHCRIDLDEDGYAEPYIVTWSDDLQKICRIEPTFYEDDIIEIDGEVYKIEGEEFFSQHGFLNSMDQPAVFYGWGFLMYDLYESLNTFMRQMIDAGTLQNVAGSSGFINANAIQGGAKTRSGKMDLIMGHLQKIQLGGGARMQDAIWTMPFQGPSQGLYTMLENLKEEVRLYTTASQSVDIQAGEAAAMYLARLQQALKVPNAISAHVYMGLANEFQRVFDLMARYGSEDEYLSVIDWEPNIEDQQLQAKYEQAVQMAQQMGQQPPPPPEQLAQMDVSMEKDFAMDFNIIPAADPSMGSDEERKARAQVVYEAAQSNPLINPYEATVRFLEEMGETQIEKLVPPPSNEPSPQDIINQEYMKSEIAKNQAKAQNDATRAELDRLDGLVRFHKLSLEIEQAQADIDKTESETVKNYSEVDASQATSTLAVMKAAQEELAKQYVPVIQGHPTFQDVTEADIEATMAANNMTREEVDAVLSLEAQSG